MTLLVAGGLFGEIGLNGRREVHARLVGQAHQHPQHVGHFVGEVLLFARLDLKEVLAKVAELHPPKAEEPAKEEREDVIDIEAKPEITFEDFGKLQFQVGKIIKCEEVKKS